MFTFAAFLALPWKKIAIVAGAAILLLFIILGVRSCFKKTPKLNEAQILEAQKAIAESDRKAMEKVLVESDVAEKQINENLVNAKTETVNAIADAKKKAEALSNEELAAELERRAKQ